MASNTVAALQIGASGISNDVTLEKIWSYANEVQKHECRLLVLPEAILGGYPKGSTFGTRLGYRTEEGREEFLEYWKRAVDLDGQEIDSVCKFAAECRCNIVMGVIERGGSTLYCSALFISDAGELVGKHRKLMPTASERLIWGQGDGSTMPSVDCDVGRIGAGICWENYMPLFRAAMYQKGINIWCAPTVDDRDIWQISMRHIAYEGRMFLISACQYQPPPDPDSFHDSQWPPGKPLIGGGSIIVSPMGEILAGPSGEGEGLITAKVCLDDVVKARYDFDPVGHYARPDVFQLTVQEEPPESNESAHSSRLTPEI